MRIAVGLSGGIDSTAALFKLKDQGHQVLAVFLEMLPGGAYQERTCCSLESRQLAERMARLVDVPFQVWDLTVEFKAKVVEVFKAQLAHGLTPNPCVYCNRYVKVSAFLDKAVSSGFEAIATGHYARQVGGNLYAGVDHRKDQSYMLALVPKEKLAKTLFPLGEMTRQEVEEYARRQGVSFVPKSSQDICFVPPGGMEEFVKRELGAFIRPGPLVFRGSEVGQHKGFPLYTVGQRRGLGLSHAVPLYVRKVNAHDNTVELAESEGLLSTTMYVAIMNQFDGITEQAQIKIRYQAAAVPAKVIPIKGSLVRVEFEKPQRAITPGQIAVAYAAEKVLWAGIILSEEALAKHV